MNQLIKLTKDLNAPTNIANSLLSKMNTFFEGVEEKKNIIDSIVVNRPDQIEEMKKAREVRLSIKNKRLEARDIVNAEREKLKNAMADFTMQDKLWLKSFQMLEAVCNNLETKCEEKEKFAERWEAEQKQLRYETRVNKLYKYGTDPSVYNLTEMDDELFEKLLQNEKLAYEARLRHEKEVEEKRIAEEKEKEEMERAIRAENERLKKEAEEREKKLAKERAEQLKKIEAEKKAREEVEKKLAIEKEEARLKEKKEKAVLEAKRKEKEEAERKALLAPDKEKLLSLISTIRSIQMPSVKSREAMNIIRATEEMITKMTNYIDQKTKTL